MLLWWFHASPHSGHVGSNRTLRKLRRYFHWPGMAKDVETFVNECILCHCFRPIPSLATTRTLTKPQAFQMISLDYMGPYKTSKGTEFFIHVAVDHCTRYLVAGSQTTSPTSDDCIAFLGDYWVAYFGVPTVVLTDRGAYYRPGLFRAFVQNVLGSKLISTSPYYPQGNGINESSHRLLTHVMKTASCRDFESELRYLVQCAQIVHNSSPNASLGTTPFHAMFGRDMPLPHLHNLQEVPSEHQRFASLRDDIYRRLFLLELERLASLAMPPTTRVVQESDIVCYPLSPVERESLSHVSGIHKWAPSNSLPYRVVTIKGGQATVVPLWTIGTLD